MNTNTQVVIDELHKAFEYLNLKLFNNELPEPAILIQSRGNRKNSLGWCSTREIWIDKKNKVTKYEVNIVAEGLKRSLFEIMTTLIHEMVHLYNLTHDIKDVSRAGTYHNKTFKKMAEGFGLLIDKAPKIGWSVSTLQEGTKDLIMESEINEDAFTLSRISDEELRGGSSSSSRKTSSRKYICPGCGTSIRSTKDVSIICGVCKVYFEKESKADEDDKQDDENEN